MSPVSSAASSIGNAIYLIFTYCHIMPRRQNIKKEKMYHTIPSNVKCPVMIHLIY
jgi:hypothetical protein